MNVNKESNSVKKKCPKCGSNKAENIGDGFTFGVTRYLGRKCNDCGRIFHIIKK